MKKFNKTVDRFDLTEIYYYLGQLATGASLRQIVLIKMIMETLDKAMDVKK